MVLRTLQSIMDNIVLCHAAIARPCETMDIQLEHIILSASFTYPREALLTTMAAGGSPGVRTWCRVKVPLRNTYKTTWPHSTHDISTSKLKFKSVILITNDFFKKSLYEFHHQLLLANFPTQKPEHLKLVKCC